MRCTPLALSAALTLAALPALARVVWRGDFETGDTSQWSRAQTVNDDRLRIVSDPVQEGHFALRTAVRKGDDPIDSSGNRNELVYLGDIPGEGDDRFYRWSILWPSTFRSADTWQLFTQWHQEDGGGSPPVEFLTRGEEIQLVVSGAKLWTAPLVRGQWHEFIVHVKWSANASKGRISVEYDGVEQLPPTAARTLLPGTGGVYLKQGLYRKDTIDWEQVIYADGMTIGTTRADVLPEPVIDPIAVLEPKVAEATFPGPGEVFEEHVTSPLTEGRRTLPGGVVALGRASTCSQAGLPSTGLLALAGVLLRRRRRR